VNNRLGSWTLALTLRAACSSTFVAAQSGRGGGYRHQAPTGPLLTCAGLPSNST